MSPEQLAAIAEIDMVGNTVAKRMEDRIRGYLPWAKDAWLRKLSHELAKIVVEDATFLRLLNRIDQGSGT